MKTPSRQSSLFIVLIGTLSFSLSAARTTASAGTRGIQRSIAAVEEDDAALDEEVQSADTCDYASQLDSNVNGAVCNPSQTINGVKTKGKATVHLLKDQTQIHLMTHNGQPTHVDLLHVDLDIESECSAGCPEHKRHIKTSFDVQADQLANLQEEIAKRYTPAASKLAKAESATRKKQEAAKKLKQQIADCEVGAKAPHDDLDDQGARMCKIDKMTGMSKAKALTYFQNNVRKGIVAMLSDPDIDVRNQGMELVKELNQNGVGGAFMKKQIAELTKLGTYENSAQLLKQKLSKMAANDPSRQAVMQQAQALDATAVNYFNGEKLGVKAINWPTDSGFNYAANATANVVDYNTQLQASMNDIMAAHAQQTATQMQLDQSRFRGAPSVVNYNQTASGVPAAAAGQATQWQPTGPNGTWVQVPAGGGTSATPVQSSGATGAVRPFAYGSTVRGS